MHTQRLSRFRFQPRIETLEDRQVPAYSVWQQGGDLFLKGTNGAENVSIVNHGDQTIEVSQSSGVTYNNVFRIFVSAGKGNDRVIYDADPQAGHHSLYMKVDLGEGNDEFIADIHGDIIMPEGMAAAVEVDSTRSQEFQVYGGKGSDIFRFNDNYSPQGGDSLKVHFHADSGDDLGQVQLPSENHGNMEIRLEGDRGNDRMEMAFGTGMETQIVNGGTMKLIFDGDSGNDRLRMAFVTSPGGQFQNNGTLGVSMEGDDGNDILEMGAFIGDTYSMFINEGRVNVNMRGGSGSDTIRLSDVTMVEASMASEVDQLINHGRIAININGDSGNDVIFVETGLAAGTTDAYFSTYVKGGHGTDYITIFAQTIGDVLGKVGALADGDHHDWLRITPNIMHKGIRQSHIVYVS